MSKFEVKFSVFREQHDHLVLECDTYIMRPVCPDLDGDTLRRKSIFKMHKVVVA